MRVCVRVHVCVCAWVYECACVWGVAEYKLYDLLASQSSGNAGTVPFSLMKKPWIHIITTRRVSCSVCCALHPCITTLLASF